jgi:hypothetical protein
VQRETPAPPTNELTDEHRAAILATIPAGVAVRPEFWARLTEIITGYYTFRTHRERYLVKDARRRWKRLEKSVAALAPQLGKDLVREFERKAKAYAAYHDTWRAYRGTRNPDREFLYWGVLRAWTDHLGGELKYSTSTDGLLTGPLVRFFIACVEPILGSDTPRPGIADIIDRAREARAPTKRHKRL